MLTIGVKVQMGCAQMHDNLSKTTVRYLFIDNDLFSKPRDLLLHIIFSDAQLKNRWLYCTTAQTTSQNGISMKQQTGSTGILYSARTTWLGSSCCQIAQFVKRRLLARPASSRSQFLTLRCTNIYIIDNHMSCYLSNRLLVKLFQNNIHLAYIEHNTLTLEISRTTKLFLLL